MFLQPCCGGSLQTGAKIVAVLEFFTSAGFFLGGLIAVQKFANATSSKYIDSTAGSDGGDVPALMFGVAYLIFALAQFILACFLLHGANKKNVRHCFKWFIGAWISLLILITLAACETYQGRLTPTILWAKPVVLGFTSLLKLYCIWTVYEFINEIPKYDKANESSDNLKEAESGSRISY